MRFQVESKTAEKVFSFHSTILQVAGDCGIAARFAVNIFKSLYLLEVKCFKTSKEQHSKQGQS